MIPALTPWPQHIPIRGRHPHSEWVDSEILEQHTAWHFREKTRHRERWGELSSALGALPIVSSIHVAPGEEVEEVWVQVAGELDYASLRQISDAVADVQLEYGFVTRTNIVYSEANLPQNRRTVYRKR